MLQPRSIPLEAWHRARGARLGEFSGFLMPLFYEGALAEHRAVRERAGLFDISHMGQIWLRGPLAGDWLNRIATQDVDKLQPGQGHYSLLLDERGRALDDIVVYQTHESQYLLCVNAGNRERDFAWLRSQPLGPELDDASEATCMFALQGPETPRILEALGYSCSGSRFCIVELEAGIWMAKSGYTGEQGVEFFVPREQALSLWERLVVAGATPAGLAARDILRLEMGYTLYGHELSLDISPLEANLSWTIAWHKDNFFGKSVLLRERAQRLNRRIYGLKMSEPGIPREAMAVRMGDQMLGQVVSGTHSPSLKLGIATALLADPGLKPGDEVEIQIRDAWKRALVSKLPFVADRSR